MSAVLASTPITPNGSYVVRDPVRTDAIGDILRASYLPRREADEMMRLLGLLDQPNRAT